MTTIQYPKTLSTDSTPVHDFDWDANGMEHRTLTCKNHTDRRWVTKNWNERTLHYIGLSDGSYAPECVCRASLLRVIA